MKTETMDQTIIISAEALLEQWQGSRRLTRRVIEAFPEDKLFEFSIGGMRPFSKLATEMIEMCGPGIAGVTTGVWEEMNESNVPKTKKELLEKWDEVTERINTYWPQIAPQRFAEIDLAFGKWKAPVYGTLFYFIDNEIHHRGQGYVYLRALGIEPPAFWER